MPPSIPARALRAIVPMFGLLALSACAGVTQTFPPVCPQTGILRDGADLTRFRGTGTDLKDMVVDGPITGLTGKCKLDDQTHLRTTISVGMDLTRGPANTARTQDVAYFVSVTKGSTILDKKVFTLPVVFPRNTDTLRVSGDPVDLVLPVDDKVTGASYRILIGFQLTERELDFNRNRGPR